MEPLISVIVPAYNAQKYVERCVKALLNQTYKNLEIVLVDDGSKDGTYELCKKMEALSDKVIACTKPNGGAASARNFGLSRIRGEYVAYMDVDDTVLEDYIAYLYQLIKKYDADVAMCDCYKMSTKETMPTNFSEGEVHVFNQTEAVGSLFYRTGVTGYPVLKLWKAQIIQNGLFPEDMLYGEDFVYVYEMLKRCSKVVYGEKVTYIYYQNTDSVNRHTNYPQLVHSWNVFSQELLQDITEKYPALEKAVIAKNYILAIDFYNRIDKRNDKENLRKRLREYIKKYGKAVYRDNNCKKLNRILGAFGSVSPCFLLFLCRRFYDVKRIFHFEVRKSV